MADERLKQFLGRCKHFTGIQHECCSAGINYRELVGGSDFGWATRLPCLLDAFETKVGTVQCSKLVRPTQEEASAELAEADKQAADFLKCLNAGICPECRQQITHRQVGHCVYGSCGHRLYQGKVNPKYAGPAPKEE